MNSLFGSSINSNSSGSSIDIMNYGGQQPGSPRQGISSADDGQQHLALEHYMSAGVSPGPVLTNSPDGRTIMTMMDQQQQQQQDDDYDNDNDGLPTTFDHDQEQHLQHHHDLKRRKASIDQAIAPILGRPVAPFDKTERKRAHTAAVYYSECVLQGIAPVVADKAAEQADDLHNKWWHRQCAAAAAAATEDKSGNRSQRNKLKRELTERGRNGSSDNSNTALQSLPHSQPLLSPYQDDDSKRRRAVDDAVSMDETENDGGPFDPSSSSSSIANVVSLSSATTRQQQQRLQQQQQQQQQHTPGTPKQNQYHLNDHDDNHDDDDDGSGDSIMHDVQRVHTFEKCNRLTIEGVKMQMIDDLRKSGGRADTPTFLECLSVLQHYYERKGDGTSKTKPDDLVGNWVVLTKPTYSEFLGRNQKGEPLYTLGRIGFDMYRPTNLVCSVQGSFNSVQPIDPKNPGRPLHVPKRLVKEIHRGECNLHTYDISVAITIEEGQDRKGQNKKETMTMKTDATAGSTDNSTAAHAGEYYLPRPIKAILTTHGYSLRDPNHPNRLSIWFSGGGLEVQDDDDLDEWRNIFDIESAPERDTRERANILAARVLLGAIVPDKLEPDGTMTFALRRPIGGHGSVYLDVLYRDDDFRLMRGHHGSVYVCCRVPDPHPVSPSV